MKPKTVTGILVLALFTAGCAGTTTVPTNVSSTTATLRANVSCAGGTPTRCQFFFRYGAGGAYQHQTAIIPAQGLTTKGTFPVSVMVTGLTPNTAYTYQLCGRGDTLANFVCVGSMPFTTSSSSTINPVADRTISAQQFSDSIGINVHENFYDTPYYNWPQTLADAKALGITHLRVGVYDFSVPAWNAKQIADYQSAVSQGFKLDAGMPQDCSYLGSAAYQDCFKVLVNSVGLKNIVATEWPNEANNDSRDPVWGTAVGNLSHWFGIPVYGPSFGLGSSPAQMGDQSSHLDFGNLHDYSGGTSPTPQLVLGEMQSMRPVSAGKPIVSTEFGQYTMPDGVQGVDQTTQAIYNLRQYFEHLADGIDTSYLYDLYDDHAGSTYYADHYGLMNNNYTRKPAASALAYVTALIGSGSPAKVTPLVFGFSQSDPTSDLRYLTIAKPNGKYDLVLWRDSDIWNRNTGQPIATTPSTIHVQGNFAPWVAYDPIQGKPTAFGSGSAAVPVGADPVILEVTSLQ